VISLLFGTIAIFPFYLITRKFFNNSIPLLASLVFAINPFFVSHSVDLIRDPIFWFFALFALYFFISAYESKSMISFLLLSSICFLIAGLARIEIIVYCVGTVAYIFTSGNKKIRLFFLLSLSVSIICFIGVFIFFSYNKNINFWAMYFRPMVHLLLYGFSDTVFSADIVQKSFNALRLFINNIIQVSYFPFLPFLFIGFLNCRKEFIKNRHIYYFMLMTVLSFISLYVGYLKVEVLVSRYVVLIMLPAFVFSSAGIERISLFLMQKGMKEKTITGVLCLYIIAFGVPPSLNSERTDKLIYKKIGEYIAQIEGNQKVTVIAPDNRIMFYANLLAPTTEFAIQIGNYEQLQKLQYQDFIVFLKENRVKYFVYNDKSWMTDYDFFATAKPEHFKEIRRWEDAHRGKSVLLEVLL
jgi:hypothetical protein